MVDEYGQEIDASQNPYGSGVVDPQYNPYMALTNPGMPGAASAPMATSGGNYIDWVQAGFPGNYDVPAAGTQYALTNPSPNTTAGAALLANKPGANPFAGGAPTGGSLSDPSYVDTLIAYWGNQPGVNPSVKSDPGYWRTQILSGHLGADQNYVIQKFMTPEGPPMGSLGGGSATNLLGGEFSQSANITAPDLSNNALYQMLLARANKDPNVDPNDPEIKAQTDAYGASQTRAQREYLASLAERQGPNANIGAETRKSFETVGQATSAFQATAMVNELTAQRTEIQQALQYAVQMNMATQAQALQAQLAQVSDSLSRAYLQQQAFQFDATRQDNLGGF